MVAWKYIELFINKDTTPLVTECVSEKIFTRHVKHHISLTMNLLCAEILLDCKSISYSSNVF